MNWIRREKGEEIKNEHFVVEDKRFSGFRIQVWAAISYGQAEFIDFWNEGESINSLVY